jgi:hypothetical protein
MTKREALGMRKGEVPRHDEGERLANTGRGGVYNERKEKDITPNPSLRAKRSNLT